MDATGNLYIADSIYGRVWRVDVMGRISRIAGTGVSGYNGDDQPATSAMLSHPTGVAVDSTGSVYIADTLNQRIRHVDASGRITTIAGTGEAGYDGDHKPATSARLSSPGSVAVDSAGNDAQVPTTAPVSKRRRQSATVIALGWPPVSRGSDVDRL